MSWSNITVELSQDDLRKILTEQAEAQFKRKVKKVTFVVRSLGSDYRGETLGYDLSSVKVELGEWINSDQFSR